MNVTYKDFKEIFDSVPELTDDGVNSLALIEKEEKNSLQQLYLERNKFSMHFEQFKICCKYLSKFRKVKTPQIDSNYLKYTISYYQNEYVSNGAVIAAAIYLNLNREIKNKTTQSMLIGVSYKCPYIKMAKSFVQLLYKQ